MKRFIILPLACALALAFSGPALGHTGLEFFLQEVPDPDAMTMDGDESDWGWFDNDLALDSNLDFYVTSGEVADPEDYSATWRIAYSRPPDNRLYFFLRIQDDSLRRQEPDLKRMWHDDFTQFNLDNDHSGGPGLGANLDEASNHQRYHLRILPGPDGVAAFNSQIEVLGDEQLELDSGCRSFWQRHGRMGSCLDGYPAGCPARHSGYRGHLGSPVQNL